MKKLKTHDDEKCGHAKIELEYSAEKRIDLCLVWLSVRATAIAMPQRVRRCVRESVCASGCLVCA